MEKRTDITNINGKEMELTGFINRLGARARK